MIENDGIEYDLISKLNKIGSCFKYLLVFIILILFIFFGYILFFKLDKVQTSGDRNSYKKAIINISFNSMEDYKKSKKYLNDYNEVFYNKTNSKIILPKMTNKTRYTKIYLNNIKNKGKLFSLTDNIRAEDLYNDDSFYFFKHFEDDSAYKRGDIFIPKFEELYSGKIVFEEFFKTSLIDFINLIAGILMSKNMYIYKYSEQIKNIVFKTIKHRKNIYFISSYNNKDSSTHEALIKAFSIYYKGNNLKSSLLNADYYLANELIADARYFNFNISKGYFKYNIDYKDNIFVVFIFRNGHLIKKSKQLHFSSKLPKGFYNVVILKNENTLFGEKELFWIYLNFKI